MRQPWICPKCNIAYAPWIDSCACQGVVIPQPIVWDKPITIKDYTTIVQPNTWGVTSSNTEYNTYIGADGLEYLYS